ncbi:MAG: DUF1311 domain-containing protein [Lachnospiraceae bacterium]|nr:DUF1311 domain-containing protein [Lachnospiraceae bacterium]MBQ5915477.1 DUF1311 domain-containing protein [Lachnospiraceae bacterium]
MKRRFWMWMTIVCILVVGVSVTKMTRDFIISQDVSKGIEETIGAAAHIADEIIEETIEEVMEAASIEAVEETVPEEVFPVFAAASPKAPIDTTNHDAIQETVKSPLDPGGVKSPVVEEEAIISYNAEDFFERFAQTEQHALQLWDNVTSENRAAFLTAAEQERALWDYELNYVYQMIRERLEQEEMEALKVMEVEWIKERDLYAEKASAKSSMKNAQNQNPDYVRALAEKTKERCYWLVSEYEDVLNPN